MRFQKAESCRKCDKPWNNPLSLLCVDHLDELRRERQAKERRLIEELRTRGPIFRPSECEHVNLYNEHCFDCGEDDEIVVCGSCKEWTGKLVPCC